MTLKELCKNAHEGAIKKGFWDCIYFNGTCLCKNEFKKINKQVNENYCLEKCKNRKEEQRNISELLMLTVSELGEACEALRNNHTQKTPKKWQEEIVLKNRTSENINNVWIKDTFEDEIADTFIRLADLCGALNIDIEWQIRKKLDYNKSRSFKHGKVF